MILYLSIGVALFCLAFLRLLGVIDQRYERPLVLGLTLLAWAVSFVRWKTGTDWDGYTAFFPLLTSVSEARSQYWWGPVYAYTAVLVNTLGAGYSVFLLCIASIQYSALYYFLTRSCAAPLVAVFVLFCGNFFGIFFVRQDLAVVFFLGFMYFYHRRQRALAVCAAAMAFAFHTSAAIPIGLVVMIVRFEWKKVLMAVPLVIIAAFLVFHYFSWSNLDTWVPALSYFGSGYLEEKESALSTTSRAFLKLAFLLAMALASYVWFTKRTREDAEPEWSAFCLKSAIVILVFTACLLPLSEIVARFPAYTYPLFAVVLSNYRFSVPKLSVAGAAYVCMLLLFFVELGFYYSGYAEAFYPLRTILTS